VVEALFRAYFTDGRDISNRQTLIDVVSETGLERQVAESMLGSDEVPFFIINNAITLSGAQEPDTFLDAFRQAISVS